MDRTEQRVYEAELYRLKGELLLVGEEIEGLSHRVIERLKDCFL